MEGWTLVPYQAAQVIKQMFLDTRDGARRIVFAAWLRWFDAYYRQYLQKHNQGVTVATVPLHHSDLP